MYMRQSTGLFYLDDGKKKKALNWFSCLDRLAVLMSSKYNLWVPDNKDRSSSILKVMEPTFG